MSFDFVVLGATGQQGRIASRDLLESGYRVLLSGRNQSSVMPLLKKYKRAKFVSVDLMNIQETTKVLKSSGAWIVLNCAELRMNLYAMEAAWEAGLHYLDLGGLQEMTQKQYQWHTKFKQKKLTALLGCGSTPGIANVMAAYAVAQLDRVSHIDLGFAWNSNLKTFVLPYSLESIVYELTTTPIVLEKGKFKKIEACKNEGLMKFRGVGEQKMHCIVHSEVLTFYKYFKEKGLQAVHYKAGFPEHSYRVIQLLMELRFTDSQPIATQVEAVIPIQFTNTILKNIPKPKNYRERETIWVKAYGSKNRKQRKIEMDCLVQPVKGWQNDGSNVDTGRTISVMAQMMKRGLITEYGVTAPEQAVPAEPFFEEIKNRGMEIYCNGRKMA